MTDRKQATAQVLAAKRRLGLGWADRVKITLNGKFLPYRVW